MSRANLNYDEGAIKNIHYGDILVKFGSIVDVNQPNVPYVTNGKPSDFTSQLLQNGDVIVADTAEDETTGKAIEVTGITDNYAASGLHTMVARPNVEFARKYLGYYLNSPSYHNALLPLMQGIKVLSLSKANIAKTVVSFPKDVKEQANIGIFFKQLDSLIAQNERKTHLLKQLKQAYLQKIFSQELRVAGFKDDWEERKLGELASVLTGFPFKNEDFVANGKYLVITNGNIQNDSSVVDVLLGNRIDDISDEIKERYYLNKNDILVTMDGTVGRTAKVVDDNLILAQRVGRLVSNTNPEFVYQWLNHGSFFNEMTKVSHGGTIKHISLNEISNYRSTVPSNNIEQQKIGAFFKQLDITIDLHQQKLDLLKKQKQAYLQKMFI
ncbi:restriction endonuclease subunit S [Leuconostoc mesenteroides]|uniref:restriction endonuclease subunit S n=1 Tax=Leuconostoc mesenteroides TaxID=1245 RepID=UPI001FA8F752